MYTQVLEQQEVEQDSIVKEVMRAFNLFEKSQYGEAVELYTKILQYAQETGNKILEGRCYSGLGNCNYYINKDSLSFYYLFKAKDVFEQEKDTFNLVLAYNDIGVNYKDFDSIDKSNVFFDKTIQLAKAGGYLSDQIYPLSNKADNEIHYNDVFDGIRHSHEVLAIIDSVGGYFPTYSVVGKTYQQLAYGYFKIGDKENHLLYFNKSVDFATKNNYLGALLEVYQENALLYAEYGEVDKTYDLVKKTLTLKDSLYKIKEFEKAKQIEATNFLKENKEKLLLVEKEKEYQEAIIKRTNTYNTVVTLFVFGLLLSLYFLFKKNKELNISKEKAEKLSKVKSHFYSEISHELRTPLYAVIELSKLLLNENVNSKHKEYLESLNFSGNHLLSLINNVLEINKVESGTMKLELLEFKLKNLIDNIIESLEFALRNSHNKIQVSYDENIPISLLGDSLKLSQVFINLISNAIKFTKNGTISITAKLIENSDDTVKIFFEIKDDGIGISKEKQVKIFEEFYQEYSEKENSYKGSGLGLSIVKRILTTMGSEIFIESELNNGSTFSFELVFLKNKASISKKQTNEALVKNLVDKHILIVDDNKINQLVTKKILDQMGIKSTVVDSGYKAIDIVRNKYFDCVLMDLHMPGLNGYEATTLIREFDKEIAILALTAASSEEVEKKINSCKMDGYIMKPFITSEFIETIHASIINKSI